MYKNLIQKKATTYASAHAFLVDAVEYFDWCNGNPLLEDLVFNNKGMILRSTKAHPRPFTKKGLATFIGVPVSRLTSYKERVDDPAWADAVAMIEQVMYEQKFSGAVAGLMNATMIKSDLEMVDRTELTGKNGARYRPWT